MSLRSRLSVVMAFALGVAILPLSGFRLPNAYAQASESSAAVASVSPEARSDPMKLIKAGISDLIAVFKDKSMPLAERRAKLRALAAQYFDFKVMARTALGYHWRTLTPQQREQFVPVFTDFLENAYLSKLQEYTVEIIEKEVKSVVINYERERIDGDYAEVYTTVQLHDRAQPVKVNYLLKRDTDGWRVYDVTVDAISVVANYRNQFNRVINNQGYDQLMSDLKAKSRELGKTLGK